jgi:3-hydroxyacyl-CoA dehydrogenase
MKPIRQAVFIGSGVMGAAIVEHIANAGIECLLFDIVRPL